MKKITNLLPLFTFLALLLLPRVAFGYEVEIPIGTQSSFTLPSYIVAAHKFATAAAGVLAVVVMMIGGFLWLSSAGNANQVGLGKGLVVGAVTGLVLTFMSYYLLYAVNPNLVDLSVTSPLPIKDTGNQVCCQTNDQFVKMEALTCTESEEGRVVKDELCGDPPTSCAVHQSRGVCDADPGCFFYAAECRELDSVPCRDLDSTKCARHGGCEMAGDQCVAK